MKHRLPCLLCLLPLMLTACHDGNEADAASLSPQEMYEKGKSLLKPNIEQDASDITQAIRLIQQAAEGGLKKAQTDLGGLYMYGGKGVKEDGAEALKWFTRAAGQGSREAEFFIGELYRKGLGVKTDMTMAMQHWRVAAEGGIAEAQQRLGHILVQQPKTFNEGLEWLKKAATEGAAMGKADAACDLGTIYARGLGGVKPDVKEAARWFAIGAEEGNAQARHIYALMLLAGESVPKDEEAGMFMLRLAASQDYLPAMADFIRCLRNMPDASPAQQAEAEAWNERLQQLLEKRRPKPAPSAAETAAE